MLYILFYFAAFTCPQEVALNQETLPTFNKLGFVQVKEEKLLFSFSQGTKGYVSLVDMEKATILPIDSEKAHFMFPFTLLHQGRFVLLDTLLKKMIYVADDGSIEDTVYFKDMASELSSLRIRSASVHDDKGWLLTLEDRVRKVYTVAVFDPATGQVTPWFEKAAEENCNWYWVNGGLIGVTLQSGEIARVDSTTGKTSKLLRPARDLMIPKVKPNWMRELRAYDRLSQVIFGSQPSILLHVFKDDDVEQRSLSALTFIDGDVVETPYSVLGEHGDKRLLFDWKADELVWEAPK